MGSPGYIEFSQSCYYDLLRNGNNLLQRNSHKRVFAAPRDKGRMMESVYLGCNWQVGVLQVRNRSGNILSYVGFFFGILGKNLTWQIKDFLTN